MKTIWIFLSLPLMNGVSACLSDVGKQVGSRRDAVTSNDSKYPGTRSHRRYEDNNNINKDFDVRRYSVRENGGDNRERDRNYTGRVWSSELRMPDDTKVNITDPPYSKKWNCPDTATLIQLKPDGVEYGLVQDLLKNDWLSYRFNNIKIHKIEKITNQCLWKKYRYRKAQVSNDLGQNDVTETLLFYSAENVIVKINEGFDERDLTMQSSNIGAAFEFTNYPDYSNAEHNTDGSYSMLLCRLALGNVQKVTRRTGKELAHAPVGFHSVNNYGTFGVYRGEQVYPEYLITFNY